MVEIFLIVLVLVFAAWAFAGWGFDDDYNPAQSTLERLASELHQRRNND